MNTTRMSKGLLRRSAARRTISQGSHTRPLTLGRLLARWRGRSDRRVGVIGRCALAMRGIRIARRGIPAGLVSAPFESVA